MALQPISGLDLHYILPPQCSVISGQLPIATTEKSGTMLLYRTFLGFPIYLTPPNLALRTFLAIRVPSILWAYPAH